MNRQIVLDTETTGIGIEQDHRIIEIGCVEIIDRKLTGNHYHTYINPHRVVDPEAVRVHGLDNEFLADKPIFANIAHSFLDFVKGSELIIHNAPFDVGFINHEFSKLVGFDAINSLCSILDTLVMAREKHPGQRNSLDALCKRYSIDNSHRQLHGALLDAEILADLYLIMTGGQTALDLSSESQGQSNAQTHLFDKGVDLSRFELLVIQPTTKEAERHHAFLKSHLPSPES